MSFMQEFRSFAIKGNMLDMAVGIVIGAAFGGIVTSFVSDVITPPIGLLIGGVDFRDLALTLKAPLEGATSVTIRYGKFIQTVVDFMIIALAIFLAVKAINSLKREQEAVPAVLSKQEQLLTEIRDLLRERR